MKQSLWLLSALLFAAEQVAPAQTQTAKRSFGYVDIEKGSFRQILRSARLVAGLPSPRAEIGPVLATVVGDNVYKAAKEEFLSIDTSPDNRFLVAFSVQTGRKFSDYNIRVFDLLTSRPVGALFNEHSISVNRATCRSPVFEAFLADKRATGLFTSEELARVDFVLDANDESTGGIDGGPVGWTGPTTLLVQYRLSIVAGIGPRKALRARESFKLELDLASSKPFQILSCNAKVSPLPARSTLLTTSSRERRYSTVLFRMQPVIGFSRPRLGSGERPPPPDTLKALIVGGRPR